MTRNNVNSSLVGNITMSDACFRVGAEDATAVTIPVHQSLVHDEGSNLSIIISKRGKEEKVLEQ
jgi:hypothetical protein